MGKTCRMHTRNKKLIILVVKSQSPVGSLSHQYGYNAEMIFTGNYYWAMHFWQCQIQIWTMWGV